MEMTLPAIFREAARFIANAEPGCLFRWPLPPDADLLWASFSNDEPCSVGEAVLGLLLLAEILETAE